MLKKALFLSLLLLNFSYAEDSNSILDKTAENLSTIWEETRDVREEGWNKTKELANDTWKITKKYSLKGKNILVAEALLNAINLSLDTNTSKVKEIIVKDDNSISIIIDLKGEKKPLTILINNFNWGITKGKEYIVFENINYEVNIGWIKHLIDFYFDIHKGYIKTPYSLSKESLLYTFKVPTKTTYDIKSNYPKEFWDKIKYKKTIWTIFNKKDSINLFSDILDKQYIDIKTLEKVEHKIHLIAHLKDSEDIDCFIDKFNWTTDKKNIITISKLNINSCKKPWINSLLKKHDNFSFTYSKVLENELLKLNN